MKSLLTEIKDALEGMTQLGGHAAWCYITPDDRWRPESTGSTCISIRPVSREVEELGGSKLEIAATVEVACFMPLTADAETVLCGSSGLYDFADDIQAILVDNSLTLTDFVSVQVGPDMQTSIEQQPDGTWLVKLPRQYIYTLERDE